jgi:rSAM/selenodomain-associated transferase 2
MNRFTLFCAGWLLDMLVLSQLGPPGRSPALFAIFYVLGFWMMLLLVRNCPRKWPLKRVAVAAVLLGMLGRLAFLDFPVGNDLYRYIWEGFIQNHGFNPYRVAPNDPSLDSLIQGDMATIWQQINHKDLSAAYPPLVMILFRILAAISATPVMFKCAMLAFDLLTLGTLILIVHLMKKPPAHLFWYAANPLILVYVAGEAHLDSVQAAFFVIGLYFIIIKKPVAGFLMLSSAVASKYFSMVALPFVMQRSNLRAWPALLFGGLWFLPFVDSLQVLFDSLFTFASSMHFNDGLAEVLRLLLGQAALPALVLILFSILAIIYLFEHEAIYSVYLAVGALLVCLPTLHPWYLLLMAPLVVLYPSRAWLYLMLASIATLPVLAIEYQTGVFREIKWLKLIEYLPFYGLFVYDVMHPKKRSSALVFPEARTVSVVIPTLNEADRIEAAIHSVRNEPGVEEIIVVDGGSHDGTPDIARNTGAQVISGPTGRGCQVRAGVALASGDIILVLHADTTLLAGTVEHMLQALAVNPSIVGGAFNMRFSDQSARVALIAWLNNFRARWFGISFGDQGQFFRRAALKELGGYPDMMLMEDVELSMRMKRFGRPLFVRDGVRASQRRWENRRFSSYIRLVLQLFVSYLVERRFNGAEDIRTDYYRKYYKSVQ